MNAVIFCRVSSREQQDEGFSLASQARLLSDYAERKGFVVTKKFEVAESASKVDERRTFQEMLEFVKKEGIQHVLVEKVDRITRSLQDAVRIDDWRNIDGNHVHFVKDSLILHRNSRSSEILQWDIKVVFARQYINNLREESGKGLAEKALQGHWPGNQKRGYALYRPEGSKRSIWKIDDSPTSEAPFIKQAYELYADTDWSLLKLQQKLFEAGWKRADNKPIQKSIIATILMDSFYTGEKFVWNKKEFAAKHEGLVNADLYARVQVKLRRKGVRYTKKEHLLRGFITCGICGRAVTAEVQKGHTYYHCTGYNGCEQRRQFIREEALEEQVLSGFEGIEIDQEFYEWLIGALKESHEDKNAYHEAAVEKIQKDIERLDRRLSNLYTDKLDGIITQERYTELAGQYKREQEEAVRQLKRHQEGNCSYYDLGVRLIELAQRARAIFKACEEDEVKRSLLGYVFTDMSLEDKVLRYSYTPAFAILASSSKQGSKVAKNALTEKSIFEPSKFRQNKSKTPTFSSERPTWLPNQDVIISILSNKSYMQNLFEKMMTMQSMVKIA